MKWMLVIALFGSTPVKTGLLFNSLDECLVAEEAARGEYIRAWNAWHEWARKNPEKASYPNSRSFQDSRIGLNHQGTCIPHAERGKGGE
ncbi:hypothetical protein [Methylobacterium oxalidis]|uniref:hypothetical protein n=1 Tax=Methylobacterium oxalidis TaxID=944322 RepID=UPI0033147C04